MEKSHQIMHETTLTLFNALKKKSVGKTVNAKEFESYLVKPGLISDTYLDVFNKLEEMKKFVNDGKVMDLAKQDILMHREYVRKFIHEAGKILRKCPGSSRHVPGAMDDRNDI